jgi:hypothetical protein
MNTIKEGGSKQYKRHLNKQKKDDLYLETH